MICGRQTSASSGGMEGTLGDNDVCSCNQKGSNYIAFNGNYAKAKHGDTPYTSKKNERAS